MPGKKFTECKVGYNKGTRKRELQYHNSRSNKTLKLTVGVRGGISYKLPGKTRRYMGGVCKKTKCVTGFWAEKNRLHEMKKKGRR